MAVMAANSPHSATFFVISVRNPAHHKNPPVTVVGLNSRARPHVTDIWRTTNANQGRTVDHWLKLHTNTHDIDKHF